MNQKGEICIGMAGAGRATELHINALQRYTGVPVCLRHVIARRREQVEEARDRHGFEKASLRFEDLLEDDEIDVIDICTPPYAHEEMILRSMRAGKHVICEKPLCGYFGKSGDREPIGVHVSKKVMYQEVLRQLDALKEEIEVSDRKFMYAENFVYAPAVNKAAEIIRKKGSRILYAKGGGEPEGIQFPGGGRVVQDGGRHLYSDGSPSPGGHPLAEAGGGGGTREGNHGAERVCRYGADYSGAYGI